MRVISIPCPHCRHRVRAAKSRTMSDMMKEITYMCQNPDCGHVFVASLEVLRTLSMSATPNPDVRIHVSQHVRNACANQLALFKND
ncbi:ogr/Delta-like zinc finger family protein [Collimonas silvisoli]|uniref:ogr/Delta-like zinc finger family protein n=1 Tax=Collimonas silvisoli TaxID=2825884 RepID=UPI001B8D326F|nr:ogr/Delta-like zinc finger family protein [Collimonas silvisoli]